MKRSSVLLGIVPVLWMILAWITISAGGRFFAIDPDYYYLLSSLDLALLQKIGLYQHPGTTVEIFGAVVIRIVHLFQHTPDDVQTAVLKDPEFFLAVFHNLSALLNGLALLALGMVSFKVTKKVWLSILLQLSPFVSSLIVIDTLGRFKAEPFLLFACLLFLALVVVYVYGEKTDGNRLALAFAGVCGFGLATKATFVPILVIPVLLLRGAKQKALFLGGTALATLAFISPVANRYIEVARAMLSTAFHTESYGSGSAGIVDMGLYKKNFAALLGSNALFAVIVLFAVVVVALTILGDYQSGARRTSRPLFKALSAVVLSEVIGFALVAKYYFDPGNSRYLLPSYFLLGFTFVLSVTVFLSAESRLQRIPRYVTLAILAAGILILMNRDDMPKQLSDNIRARDYYRNMFAAFESKNTFLSGEDFRDSARIVDLGTRTIENGLFQAATYSVGQQGALQRIYATTYFCQCTPGNWRAKGMTDISFSRSWSAEAIMARYAGKKIVLFYTDGATPATYVMDAPLNASGAILRARAGDVTTPAPAPVVAPVVAPPPPPFGVPRDPMPNSAPPLDRWKKYPGVSVVGNSSGSAYTVQGNASQQEYQILSPEIAVPPGSRLFVRVRGTVDQGSVCLGILGDGQEKWLLAATPDRTRSEYSVDTGKNTHVSIVFANCKTDPSNKTTTKFTLESVTYGQVQ